jgi:hypothetical protein
MAIRDYLIKIEQNNLNYRDSIYGRFPSKPGDGGDDCLWLGLLTSVGYTPASQMIWQCQAKPPEPRAGMFYRNPERRSNDNAIGAAFFSRDMAMGVLMAMSTPISYDSTFSKSKDDARIYWLEYIRSQKYCAIKKPKWAGGGCLLQAYKFAPDDRSDVTPGLWALMGRIWNHNGWERYREMDKWKGTDGDPWILECRTAPIGYQLHLQACHAWIKIMIGQSREYYERALNIIAERAPFDLFYKILNQRSVTQDNIDEWARVVDEKVKIPFGHRWCWGNVPDGFYDNCCGWDLYFLGLLMMHFGAK